MSEAVDDEAGVPDREQADVRPPEPPARGRARRRAARARDAPAATRRSASPATTSEAAATIVTYGGMVPIVLEAVTELIVEQEIFCEVVALGGCCRSTSTPCSSRWPHRGAGDGRGRRAHRRHRRRDRGPRAGGVGDLRRPVRRVAARDGIIPPRAGSRMRRCPARTTSSMRRALEAETVRTLIEIILTREDANSEFALLVEWL